MSFLKRLGHSNSTQDGTEFEYDETIDPELRLRTVRTAASAIQEGHASEARAERRKSRRIKRSFFRRGEKKKSMDSKTVDPAAPPSTEVKGKRRNIYVNSTLSASEVDQYGEPTARYVRNKVRTSKYTIFTFIPKNLYEQFRRVANIYFLTLIILQVFPIFGAASPAIAMVPLLFILTVTALKDGVEDYRRASLDEEVNTSAATKLGQWRNVNQPTDPRNWFEKLLGLNAPGKVTKGVRKLRDREASEAGDGVRIMLSKSNDDSASVVMSDAGNNASVDSGYIGAGGRRLDDIQSMDSHSYPPHSVADSSTTQLGVAPSKSDQFSSLSNYQQSIPSRSSQGVIDWRKHSNGSARWERTLWKKLEVGDVVLLRENDQVPADIVVLSSSDPDGMCYLETKNLDGETNLKARKSVKATTNMISEEDIDRSSFILDSEPPHQNLYVYHGVLRYKDLSTGQEKQEPVSINELLLRGCSIRNTSWVIGLVVFTGADTKIMLNGGDTPSKRSKIEKETNFNVIVNFGLLIIMCAVAGVLSGVYDGQSNKSSTFFEIGADATNSTVLNGLVTFASCLIAFQNIVPISLYISIEIVKTIQAYFISQDIDMYYKPYDTPCVPKTWNISDDLGQIEYVFSDKTGTLTQNIMEFQKCSIGGIAYGEGVTEAQRGAAARAGKESMDPEELNEKLGKLKDDMLNTMERNFKNRYGQADKLTLVSPKLADALVDRNSPQREHLIAFFKALALCHSVLADRPEPREAPFQLLYKAESPDEAALVAAARDVGFPFVGKSKDGIDIEIMGQPERYTPLRVLEFNSTRKRMSVVMRCPDGRLILYCKGADSVIYERLAKDHDPVLKASTAADMESFANSGLRTLCIAFRWLTEEEYLNWSHTYDLAANSTVNRDEELDKANEQIEHSLIILGATALEDKLQEGVPEAIEMLHRAGIKLWILTGDKLQTAIEIGFSCNLLKADMDLMILSADSVQETRNQIEAGLNKIASVLGPPSWDPRKRGFVPGKQAAFAVVIDGDTLRHALTDQLKPLFLNLGTQCETVVCCRVSPAQKALTVKLVKEGRNAMTLSIGDGANDVAMIQEANIGCGLFGLEGSQAAMSADYAFGQFRFLTKLLLVHGRWSYQRIADMHSNFFYKNVVWTIGMFWYLPFNSFDATYLYQYTFILLYNTIFTSMPVIALGAFDQDINAKAAFVFPQLYVRGIRGLEYTRSKFWLYMIDGLYQSAAVFFIPYAVWTSGLAVSWNGLGIDSLSDFGTTVAVAAIFTANLYVGMNTNYWTVITWLVVVGSSIIMLLWILVFSFFFSSDFINEVVILFGELTFWTTVLFTVFVCLLPHFILKFWTSTYFPLDKEIVREMWVAGDLKDQLGIGHRNGKIRSGTTASVLEAAPMFHEPHARSLSEASIHQYEPAETTSPSLEPHVPYVDNPALRQPFNLNHDNTLAPVHQYQHDSLTPPPIAERGITPSPGPSYYSVSDLPPSSPLPEPTYQYTTGEVTTNAPSSRRTSLRSNATRQSSRPPQTPTTPTQYYAGPTPTAYDMPSAYEMRVRSPPNDQLYPAGGGHEQRSASNASYATNASFATAHEEPWPPSDDTYGGHNLDVAEPNDRRASGGSWTGGRAL